MKTRVRNWVVIIIGTLLALMLLEGMVRQTSDYFREREEVIVRSAALLPEQTLRN